MNSSFIRSMSFFVLLLFSCVGFGSVDVTLIASSADNDGVEAYTNSEAQWVFLEHLKANLEPSETPGRVHNLVVLGTVHNNRSIKRLVDKGFVTDIEPRKPWLLIPVSERD